MAMAWMLLASATVATAAEIGEPVPLYTNADLEKFGPPAEVSPATVVEDPGWEFVIDFLERERAGIDADRAHALDQRHVGLAEDEAARRPAFGHGYPTFYAHPFVHRTHRPARARPGVHRGSPSNALGNRIVPLHARPSNAMRQRARAIQHSGVDAFPSNSRH